MSELYHGEYPVDMTPLEAAQELHDRLMRKQKETEEKVRKLVMSEVKHTPLPWKLDTGFEILGRDAAMVASTFQEDALIFRIEDECQANARLIVQAVNSHGDLVEALRRIAEGNLGDAPWQANYAKIREVAKEALSKVLELGEGL